MEEDIKILEEFIKYFEAEAISRKYRRNISITVGEDDIQAIENLIKGYRELEEENSKIEYVEKETIHNANPEDWNTKGRYTIRYHNRIDVIPKSKIKEHIKNRKKSIDDIWSRNKIELDYETVIKIKRLEIEIDVLETLMEEE